MTSKHESLREQRDHKRYTLSGKTLMRTAGKTIAGEVIDLNSGGMLVQSKMIAPVGTEIEIEFLMSEPAGSFEASVRGIVRCIQPGRVEIQFLEGPPGLAELLMGLEKD